MKSDRSNSDPGGLLQLVADRLESATAAESRPKALRAWLLRTGLGRSAALQQLKAELDQAQADGRALDAPWQRVRDVVDDLLQDFTVTRPDGASPESEETTGGGGGTHEAGAGHGRAPPVAAEPVAAEPEVPQRVAGRYRLLEPVHRHAGVRVHRGVDEGAGGSDVSVRLLQSDGDGLPRADTGLAPRVAGVAALLAEGVVDGWRYRVSEWVPGDTLADLLALSAERQGVLVDATRWIRQLGATLERLHASGCVHGDVSPGNVVLTPEGDARLIDCGFVPVGQPRASGGGGLTVEYASPEAIDGAPCDPRDDVFALALIAMRLHAPLPARVGGSGTHPLADRQRPESVDQTAWQALHDALQPQRERRTASAQAFADAFTGVPVSAPAGRPRPAARRPRRRRRRRRAPWLMAAAVLAAAGAGVWVLNSPDPSAEALREWLVAQAVLPVQPGPDASAPATSDGTDQPPAAAPPDVPGGERPADTAVEEPVGAQAPAEAADASPVEPAQAAPPTVPDPQPAPPEPELATVDVPAFGAAPVPESVAPVRYRLAQAQLSVSRLDPAIMLEVRRDGPVAEAAEVAFSVVPGSAVEDEDYVSPPQQHARFGAGERATLIVIPLVRGVETRGERTLTVRLQPAEADTAGVPDETRIVLRSWP